MISTSVLISRIKTFVIVYCILNNFSNCNTYFYQPYNINAWNELNHPLQIPLPCTKNLFTMSEECTVHSVSLLLSSEQWNSCALHCSTDSFRSIEFVLNKNEITSVIHTGLHGICKDSIPAQLHKIIVLSHLSG